MSKEINGKRGDNVERVGKDTARKEWEKRKIMRDFAIAIDEYYGKKINHCLQENLKARNAYIEHQLAFLAEYDKEPEA